MASAICPQSASSFTVPTAAEVEIRAGLFITLYSNHTSASGAEPGCGRAWATLAHPRFAGGCSAGEGAARRVTPLCLCPTCLLWPQRALWARPCSLLPCLLLGIPLKIWAYLHWRVEAFKGESIFSLHIASSFCWRRVILEELMLITVGWTKYKLRYFALVIGCLAPCL